MNEEINSSNPQVTDKARLSMVWLLPLVAFLIGMGMVFNNWHNRGVQIQINFETAEGLEAGKTTVKNRDVDIGVVKSVGFSQDQSYIVVGVEIDKSMRSFLRSDSQFWVVRPRIGSSGVSGIGTLLSGAYIQVSPGKSEVFADTFNGLETPPITSPNEAGIQLTLVSSGGKSLRIGNPVIYRGFDVGRVESYEFDTESRQAKYGIFIRSPYDSLVTSNTFFWNTGGISVKTSAEGVKLDIASLEALIAGGVQFDVPEDLSLGEKITESRAFSLYDSEESITTARRYDFLEYVVLVEDSVGGLYKGAPVEYRGIRIGTVVTPYMGYNQTFEITQNEDENRIPVVIHIEPGRVINTGTLNLQEFDQQFRQWVLKGLTASIETSSYITGSLKVSLDYNGEPQTDIEQFGPYAVIPATQGGFASITEKFEDVMTKIEQLPLEAMINGANQTIGTADETLLSLNQTLLELQKTLAGVQPDSSIYLSLDQSLVELRSTLKGLQPDSSIYQSLEQSMLKLEKTLGGLQPILKKVSNKPSSLVFSGSDKVDVEPAAKKGK